MHCIVNSMLLMTSNRTRLPTAVQDVATSMPPEDDIMLVVSGGSATNTPLRIPAVHEHSQTVETSHPRTIAGHSAAGHEHDAKDSMHRSESCECRTESINHSMMTNETATETPETRAEITSNELDAVVHLPNAPQTIVTFPPVSAITVQNSTMETSTLEKSPQEVSSRSMDNSPTSQNDHSDHRSASQQQLEHFSLSDKVIVPLMPMLLMIMSWIVVLLCALFRGSFTGGGSIVGVQCGTIIFWIILFLPVPIIGLLAAITCHYVYRRYVQKVKLNYPFVVRNFTL